MEIVENQKNNFQSKNWSFLLADILLLAFAFWADPDIVVVMSWLGSPVAFLFLVLIFFSQDPRIWLNRYNKYIFFLTRILMVALILVLSFKLRRFDLFSGKPGSFAGVGFSTGLFFLAGGGILFVFNIINIVMDIYNLSFGKKISNMIFPIRIWKIIRVDSEKNIITFLAVMTWLTWMVLSTIYILHAAAVF